MDFVTNIKSWIIPDQPQQKIMNVGIPHVPSTPAPTHDHFPPHNPNFNENIVTTSVFIVMVLIFIGVLLIACCKVLIGCTARSFLGTSNSPAHRSTTRAANAANMIYTINGQTVLANGQPIPASLHPSSTQPPQLPRTTTGNPPNYDELSVHSLPPVYQFESDKSESEKGNNSSGETNDDIELAILESVKSTTGSVVILEDIVVKSQDGSIDEDAQSCEESIPDVVDDAINLKRSSSKTNDNHKNHENQKNLKDNENVENNVKNGSDDNATSHV